MVHGNLQHAQWRARGSHLHFKIPAIGPLFHAQLVERLPPDRAERTHVGIADAVQQPEEPSRDTSGKHLLEVHAAALPFAAGSRPNDEILFAAPDWINQLGHKLGTIAAVAIEEHNDVAIGSQGANAGGAGASITRSWLRNDFRPGGLGPFGGAI